MVMNSQAGTREGFQYETPTPRREVKAARLEPYSFGVGNPELLVLYIDIGDEMSPASLIRIKTIAETTELSDWHLESPLILRMQVKDLADYLPFSIRFQECEEVSETMAGPIVEFQAYGCDCAFDVDIGNV